MSIKSVCTKTHTYTKWLQITSANCIFSLLHLKNTKTEQIALPKRHKTALTTEITPTSRQTGGFMKQHSDLSEHSAKIGK